MRYKLTVLLIILNVAIFSLIFYMDRASSIDEKFKASSRLILDPVFVQALDRVSISSTSNDIRWELQKSQDGDWIITNPINWKANPFAVKDLLFQLKELSWESRFPVGDLAQAGQSLESYNLASPPVSIELSSGPSTQTLALGAPTEIGNRLYTMSPDGEYIMVISQGVVEMLRGDLNTFKDRRIFGEEIDGSSVIQVQDRSASNVRVRLERSETGWDFVSPISAKADNERVKGLITEWQNMEAVDISSSDEPELEINGNALRLTFEGLNRRETLLLAPVPAEDDAEGYFKAKRDRYGAVFKVPNSVVEKLRHVQEELREKRVLHSLSENWTSLTVQFGEITTTIQQLESGAWQVLHYSRNGELDTQPADRAAIEEINSLMREMEAVRFVSDAPSETDIRRFGLDAPQRTVTLKTESNESVKMLIGDISRESGETLLYASTNQSASVFLIRPHVLAGIPLNPLHYRDRTISTIPETATVGSIRIVERKTGSEVFPADTTDMKALSDRLENYMMNVRVVHYLNNVFKDPLQLDDNRTINWPYEIVANINYSPGSGDNSSKTTLYLSDRLGGTTQYIANPISGLTGTIPIDLIELLDPLFATFPEEPESPAVPGGEATP